MVSSSQSVSSTSRAPENNLYIPSQKRSSNAAKRSQGRSSALSVTEQHSMLKEARKARNAVIRQLESIKQIFQQAIQSSAVALPPAGTPNPTGPLFGGGVGSFLGNIVNIFAGTTSGAQNTLPPPAAPFVGANLNTPPLINSPYGAPLLGMTSGAATIDISLGSGGLPIFQPHLTSNNLTSTPTVIPGQKNISLPQSMDNSRWNLTGMNFPIFDPPPSPKSAQSCSILSSITKFFHGLWSSVTHGLGRLLFGSAG